MQGTCSRLLGWQGLQEAGSLAGALAVAGCLCRPQGKQQSGRCPALRLTHALTAEAQAALS